MVLFCCRQALAEFEMYRQRMEDSQLCTEAQHTQRVVSMSREVRLYEKYKENPAYNVNLALLLSCTLLQHSCATLLVFCCVG